MLKVVSKLKTSKWLNILTVDMKANNSILVRLEMARIVQNKQKCLIFIMVPLCIVLIFFKTLFV